MLISDGRRYFAGCGGSLACSETCISPAQNVPSSDVGGAKNPFGSQRCPHAACKTRSKPRSGFLVDSHARNDVHPDEERGRELAMYQHQQLPDPWEGRTITHPLQQPPGLPMPPKEISLLKSIDQNLARMPDNQYLAGVLACASKLSPHGICGGFSVVGKKDGAVALIGTKTKCQLSDKNRYGSPRGWPTRIARLVPAATSTHSSRQAAL